MKAGAQESMYARSKMEKMFAFAHLYGGGSAIPHTYELHFAVFRTCRAKLLRTVEQQAKEGRPGKPDVLCGQAMKGDDRTVESFIRAEQDPKTKENLCSRCLLMYRVAVANGIPVRHQRLDQVIRNFLSELK